MESACRKFPRFKSLPHCHWYPSQAFASLSSPNTAYVQAPFSLTHKGNFPILTLIQIKCVGTDGASLGTVTGKEAVQTHWAGLTQGMNYVEYLTNIGTLPAKGAFFIFAPLKEEGVIGGIGRGVGILP
jgi:kynurenine formamidase